MPALVFDCDGVLADTERDGHLPAFNQTFREFSLPVQWGLDDYAEKLLIGGGKERMASLLTPQFIKEASLPEDPALLRSAVEEWHRRKTEIYTAMVRAGRLPGRAGVTRLVKEAIDAGWSLAVASTSAPASVHAVLEHVVGTDLADRFDLVLAGDVVPRKKPAPDVYELTVERLAVDRREVVAIEDSRNGLLSATSAGLCTLVTISAFTALQDFREAALVVTSLGDPDGERMEVLANRTKANPHDWIVLRDLLDCMGSVHDRR
jgi:HAD superfamily hydrolase (TIGR01509 family)